MTTNGKKFVIIIFILAIASGIVWGMPFDVPLRSDAHTFQIIADVFLKEGFLSGNHQIGLMADRLFYPAFIAVVYKIFGYAPMVIKLLQVIIYASLAVLVYKFCQDIFDERTARLAGFLTAVCYSLAAFTSWLYREVFFSFLVFLTIYCLYQAQKKKKYRWFFLAGLVFGAAALTNSAFQFFILFILLNFLFLNRKELKKILPRLAVLVLAFAIVIAPWGISNKYHFDLPLFPIGSRGGFILLMKSKKMQATRGKYIQHLVANTTGDFIAQKLFVDYNPEEARFGFETRDAWEAMVTDYDRSPNQKQLDEEFAETAKREFIHHPVDFLKITFLDFLKFNTPMVPDVRMQHMFAEPGTYTGLSDAAKISIILAIRLAYLILAIIILYAIWKNFKKWGLFGWLILLVFYFNAMFSLIHAIARYSVPVYPFYIILLSVGLISLWDIWNSKNI